MAGAGRALRPPRAGPLPQRPLAEPFRDRVLEGSAAAARVARAPVAAAAAEQAYTTPDGHHVAVEVSPAYAADSRKPQAFVDFLGSRLHGFELGRLHVLIATPSEVGQLCGADALACYVPRRLLMIVPGEQTADGQASLEYTVTHEYGHHITLFRSNEPWPAPLWGPKYWATYEHVCEGVVGGLFFPGDEAEHYFANPAENWAESYARYHYRDSPWQFLPVFEPDAGAYAAIERDVTQPWRRPRARIVRGSFSPRRRHAVRFRIRDALDGRVSLMLRGPRHADFDLRVTVGGRRVDGTHAGGTHDRLRGDVCNQPPRLTVQVVRRAGYGRFALRISAPG